MSLIFVSFCGVFFFPFAIQAQAVFVVPVGAHTSAMRVDASVLVRVIFFVNA
jgi:hypothetical protein